MRFKHSSLMTKILILVLVVYATGTLVSLQNQVAEKNAEAELLQSSRDAIDTLDTDGGVEAVARQKLGWVAKGEIVFYDMGN